MHMNRENVGIQGVVICAVMLQCVAVCYSVLQCVAVCCSVLQGACLNAHQKKLWTFVVICAAIFEHVLFFNFAERTILL